MDNQDEYTPGSDGLDNQTDNKGLDDAVKELEQKKAEQPEEVQEEQGEDKRTEPLEEVTPKPLVPPVYTDPNEGYQVPEQGDMYTGNRQKSQNTGYANASRPEDQIRSQENSQGQYQQTGGYGKGSQNQQEQYRQANQYQQDGGYGQGGQYQQEQYRQANQYQQPGQDNYSYNVGNNTGYHHSYDTGMDPSPMTMGDWVLTILASLIPCAGIVLYFYWAFSRNGNLNRRNYCRASLIISGVLLAIYLIIFMIFGFTIIGAISSNYSYPY